MAPDPIPAVAPPGVPTSGAARPSFRTRLLAPLRAVARRPGRSLLGAALLLALLFGGWQLALYLHAQGELAAARREVRKGHNGRALRHLVYCNHALPDHPEVLLLSARVSRRSGALDEAEFLLDRYWEVRGDDDDLVRERLLLRAARGDAEAALPLLKHYRQSGAAEFELCYEAAVFGSLLRFRYKQADALLTEWQKDAPESALVFWMRGRYYEQLDNDGEARKAYRAVLERDADHDEARLRLAALLLKVSQAEEAIEHLDYLKGRPLAAPAELHLNLARALDLLGRPAEARAALHEALRLAPDDAQALAESGRLARIAGEEEEAERLLRAAVVRDPGNVVTRYQLYLTLQARGKQEEAKAEQERIRKLEDDMTRIRAIVNGKLQQNPNDPELHYDVAMIALRAGLPREVRRWLLSGLQADPKHLPTHRALATYYREMGQPILAARHRSIAQQLAGNRPK